MAARFKVRTVVTNDVLFHEPGRRQLQDIVTCIRHNTTIDDVGFERSATPTATQATGGNGTPVSALRASTWREPWKSCVAANSRLRS